MNGNSKREKVDSFIRRAVREAIYEECYNCPEAAQLLRQHAQGIIIGTAARIRYDSYRMKELQDIFDWKKPPKNE